MSGNDFYADLGSETLRIVEEVLALDKNRIIDRIWKKDHSVWSENPDEISNRLGWLDSPETMAGAVDEINLFVDKIRASGFQQVLLLGMGGSSLAPEVFRYTFGVAEDYLDLSILDSTDPGVVLEKKRNLDLNKTLFIVSTKSGGTVETISFMKYFYHTVLLELGSEKVGQHFIAITDPGSGLESMAQDLKFRKIFLNDPNIGGRYSALSYFGMVPAALLGIDINELLVRARQMVNDSKELVLPETGKNSAAWLGAILGVLSEGGKDKVTFISSPSLIYFGAWLEQLIAESTGKEGKGILPVNGETPLALRNYTQDRLFVYLKLAEENALDNQVAAIEKAGHPMVRITLNDLYDLGGEFFRWEVATAIAGKILRINPFDQPDVESAKVSARQMMAEFKEKGKLPDLPVVLEIDGIKVISDETEKDLSAQINKFFQVLNTTDKNAYVALHAYLKSSDHTDQLLRELRSTIQQKYNLAVTVGYGPRFLHSTGQLHKGDGGNGMFIQLLADMPEDCSIPDDPSRNDSGISFGILKTAQAMGDRQALLNANRKVITIDLGSDISNGLQVLMEALK